MNTNILESIAAALFYACARDLSPIEYQYQTPAEFRDKKPGVMRTRRPEHYECSVVSFPQAWGSTALGFGGIGAQAITTAQTTVITGNRHEVCVYFDTRFAYRITRPNKQFFEDVAAQHLAPVNRSAQYEE